MPRCPRCGQLSDARQPYCFTCGADFRRLRWGQGGRGGGGRRAGGGGPQGQRPPPPREDVEWESQGAGYGGGGRGGGAYGGGGYGGGAYGSGGGGGAYYGAGAGAAGGGAAYYGQQRRPRRRARPRRSGGGRGGAAGGGGSRRSPPKEEDKGPSFLSVLLVVIILVILLMVLPIPSLEDARNKAKENIGVGVDDLLPQKVIRYPESLEFTCQRRVTIAASGGSISTWEYRAVAPRDIPSTGEIQDVISVGVTPRPNEGYPNLDDTDRGDLLMTWDGEDLSVGADELMTIDYHIKTYTHDWDVYKASDYGTVGDIDQDYVDRYVRHEWLIDDDGDGYSDGVTDAYGNSIDYRIDPNNPTIRSLADTLSAGKNNAYSKAKAFYEYLHSNVAYPNSYQQQQDAVTYNNLPKYCTGTLADGRGDCDDQSITFISLCRAAGIPAWLELGYLYEQSSANWGGHGWANVYLPLKSSVSERGYMIAPVDVVNSQFLFRGPYRFTDAVDNGDEGYLNYFYSTFSYTYSSGGGRASFDDEFITGMMKESGSVVREVPEETSYTSAGELDETEGDGSSTPGFGGAAGLLAMATAAVVTFAVLGRLAGTDPRLRR